MEQQKTTRPGPEPEPEPEFECLLSLSSFLLSLRDFTNSREYALKAQRSDPNFPGPDQIIAVANVILAAERRLENHQLDWYSILQITRPATRPEIETRFRTLVDLLNPTKNQLPFSQEAFKLVCDAWSVLSDPEKKTRYDNDNENVNVNVNNGCRPRKAEKTTRESGGNEGKKGGSFWTVCPYCFHMYEYESVYEECCLRCQNCRRAFHGVAVDERLPESVVVKGKEEYFCGFGFFPLGYSLGCGDLGDKKAKFEGKSGGGGNLGDKKAKFEDTSGWDNVVDISDDSDDEKNVNVTSGGEGRNVGSEKVEVRNNGKRVMKNVKSVVRNSKKIMAKGVKTRRTEQVTGPRVGGMKMDVEFGNGGGCFEDEMMDFFEGDNDFFV